MSMFEDEEKMVIPYSIDDIDPIKTNYFFSTKKMVIAFIGIIPYVVGVLLLYSAIPNLPIIIAFTLIYLIFYLWLLRTFVLEEQVLRDSLYEMQDNKKSGYEYFWEIDKVGDNVGRDDGLLYLRQDGTTLKRGLIISFDSGSIVGTSDDFIENYRKTQQKFLRYLYQNKMSFKWYKIKKEPEINPSLFEMDNKLRQLDNDALRKLLKLQVNGYLRYSMESEQRYVDYIVVTNKDFSTLMNFKQVLEDIVNNSFKTNPAFKDVKILDKPGVDEFFANYYMQEEIDVNSIQKTNKSKPFSHFAKVTRIVDRNDRIRDVDMEDELNQQILASSARATNLEDDIAFEERKAEQFEKRRLQDKENEIKSVNKKRIDNRITHEEYLEQLEEIEELYSEENYVPNRKEKEREEERLRIREEREEKRIAEREAKELAKNPLPEPKWFEEGGKLGESKVLITEETHNSTDYDSYDLNRLFEEDEEDDDPFSDTADDIETPELYAEFGGLFEEDEE